MVSIEEQKQLAKTFIKERIKSGKPYMYKAYFLPFLVGSYGEELNNPLSYALYWDMQNEAKIEFGMPSKQRNSISTLPKRQKNFKRVEQKPVTKLPKRQKNVKRVEQKPVTKLPKRQKSPLLKLVEDNQATKRSKLGKQLFRIVYENRLLSDDSVELVKDIINTLNQTASTALEVVELKSGIEIRSMQ